MVLTQAVNLNTGAKMPILGLGTFLSNPDEVKQAVLAAIDCGYRHIDTAFNYQNEEAIGDALQEAFKSGKVKRDDLFIVTKLPQIGHKRERVAHFLKLSLKKLKLEYVDMYLIHSPFCAKYINDDELWPKDANGKFYVDTESTYLDTWKGMEDCVNQGLTKAIGLSNFNSQQIQDVLDHATIKPANLQVECNAYFGQKELHEFCTERGITFTAYAPMGSPGLPGPSPKTETSILINDPVLKNIGAKHNKSAAQVALRWLIQRNIVVIPKSINPARIKQNSEVFDFTLNEEEMKAISSLHKGERRFKFDFINGMTEHPDSPFNIPF